MIPCIFRVLFFFSARRSLSSVTAARIPFRPIHRRLRPISYGPPTISISTDGLRRHRHRPPRNRYQRHFPTIHCAPKTSARARNTCAMYECTGCNCLSLEETRVTHAAFIFHERYLHCESLIFHFHAYPHMNLNSFSFSSAVDWATRFVGQRFRVSHCRYRFYPIVECK